ncbi:hypothetical protein [Sinorhizobium meliloti]|uniref:hypothetical protein n=1 Tax=Rhizobium meliloti TaxID=382 RepID=UPI001295ABAD|nr:hypothetical protein [Sinorhizobium meliloti]MQX90270.1 hypothetical protein [Sinorhizobium meliloti]
MSTRLIQDLHAGISRRDWDAVEVAANRLRDDVEDTRRILAGTGIGSLPNDYPLPRLAADALSDAIAVERAWQPIKTAPKDWTDVLLFVPNLDSDWRNVCEGYYDAENEVWENPMFGAVDPTRWQPLPAPPETEREAME